MQLLMNNPVVGPGTVEGSLDEVEERNAGDGSDGSKVGVDLPVSVPIGLPVSVPSCLLLSAGPRVPPKRKGKKKGMGSKGMRKIVNAARLFLQLPPKDWQAGVVPPKVQPIRDLVQGLAKVGLHAGPGEPPETGEGRITPRKELWAPWAAEMVANATKGSYWFCAVGIQMGVRGPWVVGTSTASAIGKEEEFMKKGVRACQQFWSSPADTNSTSADGREWLRHIERDLVSLAVPVQGAQLSTRRRELARWLQGGVPLKRSSWIHALASSRRASGSPDTEAGLHGRPDQWHEDVQGPVDSGSVVIGRQPRIHQDIRPYSFGLPGYLRQLWDHPISSSTLGGGQVYGMYSHRHPEVHQVWSDSSGREVSSCRGAMVRSLAEWNLSDDGQISPILGEDGPRLCTDAHLCRDARRTRGEERRDGDERGGQVYAG